MRMFITSKNKYLSNDMKIFGTCSIPLRQEQIYKNISLHNNYLFNMHLQVEADSAARVSFWIIPRMIGNVPIHVQAQSTLAADGLIRMLLVEVKNTFLFYFCFAF